MIARIVSARGILSACLAIELLLCSAFVVGLMLLQPEQVTQAQQPPEVERLAANTPGESRETTEDWKELQADLVAIRGNVQQVQRQIAALKYHALVNRSNASSLADRLEKRITLQFPRDTHQKAIEMVRQETGIEILTSDVDLRLEGVTSCQSFGLDERNQPVRDVLCSIVKQANPAGKLVFVARKGDEQRDFLVLTTRSAAAKRNEPILLAAYEPQSKPAANENDLDNSPNAAKELKQLRGELGDLNQQIKQLQLQLDELRKLAEASANTTRSTTLQQRLNRPIHLSFPRDTLEKALERVSQGIDVPITIIGTDLRLEGITKNQSFGLDEQNKPASEVLLNICKQANPDGKLVFVARKDDAGRDTLALTTIAAVNQRNETVLLGAGKQPTKPVQAAIASNGPIAWHARVTRPQIMRLLEHEMRGPLDHVPAPPQRLDDGQRASVSRAAELLSVLAGAVGERRFDFADEPEYQKHVDELRQATKQLLDALQGKRDTLLPARISTIRKACDHCHGDYR